MHRFAVRIGLVLALAGAAVGCRPVATDARAVRDNLTRAGYSLGPSSSPDPRAAPYHDVISSECFAATQAGTVQVCVWQWPGRLPDSFPLEAFTQENDATTEARDGLFVAVSPAGTGESLGYRTVKLAWTGSR